MKVLVNDVEMEIPDVVEGVEVLPVEDYFVVRTGQRSFTAQAIQKGGKSYLSFGGVVYEVEEIGRVKRAKVASGQFVAPMPGMIVEVLVSDGEVVTKGQKLLILEAMKTQQPIVAPFDGVVSELSVEKGRQVNEGDSLVRIIESK